MKKTDFSQLFLNLLENDLKDKIKKKKLDFVSISRDYTSLQIFFLEPMQRYDISLLTFYDDTNQGINILDFIDFIIQTVKN